MSVPDPSFRHHPAALHLDTQVSYRLGVPLIYLKGELDHDSAAYLRELIAEETRDDPPALVLELSELSYMDSGGLSLMFDLARTVSQPRWIGLVGANTGVARLLEVTGLSDQESVKTFADLRAAKNAADAIASA
jgi:anti-sigma B factor antagonist